MVTIKLLLDTRKSNKDNLFPICLRIYHDGKASIRSTKIYIREDQWNEEKKIIRSNHPHAPTLNRRLTKDLADLQSQLLFANEETVKEYLAPKIVEPIKEAEPEPKLTVYGFANELIRELKTDNRIGNAWVYEATANALKRFHPDEQLYFDQIDYKFLDSYNKFLLRQGLKPNTAFLYLRTLRAFYNKAINHKIVDRNLYPFYDFTIKGEKTKKRAVDKDIISLIMKVDLPK